MNRTIKNPMVGDQVTFLESTEETKGAYVLVEVELNSGGGNDLHYHTRFDEHFEVLEGELNIFCEGQEYVLRPSDTITAPANSIHRFRNNTKDKVRFRAIISPALNFEKGIRIAYGLAVDGKCTKKGLPKNFWHLAVLIDMGETYFPGIPYNIQRKIYKTLGHLARLLGKDKELYKYLE